MESNNKNFTNLAGTYNQVTGLYETGFSLSQYMTHIYTWMTLGLVLTGFVAVATASSATMMSAIFGSPLFFVLIIGELAMVWGFSAAAGRGASLPVLSAMFLAYSALNGLTLSIVLYHYTAQSVASTFFITASMFGGLALYGFITKRELSGVGRFAFMALWGIIIASLVNIFFQSSAMAFLISIAGVGIFSVLTAYDTQKLRQIYEQGALDETGLKRVGLMGALTLYLDFINLFLHLLRLLGDRRRS
jgi:FtsH-binding integral membrane protein